jgi:hypothetical protein
MSAGIVETISLHPEIVTTGTGTSAIHTLRITRDGTVITTVTQYAAAGTTVEINFVVPAGHALGLMAAGAPRTNPFTVSGSIVAEHVTDLTLTSTTSRATAQGTLKVKIETKPTQDDARPKPALL